MTFVVHLKCEREGATWKGLITVDPKRHIYESTAWRFDLEKAQQLVGGWIYLHTAKAEPSGFGGKVLLVRQFFDEAEPTNRIAIQFEAAQDARDVEWAGADHDMAWTSGIIER
jgi:hypothetical protein